MPPLTDLDPADFLRLVDRRRTNTALLTYRPGMVLPGQSFTRATTATYYDAAGVLQTAPVNGLRDAHYVGGTRTTLLEGPRTNSALWSSDFTNGVWGKTLATITASATTGPDGVVNSAQKLVGTAALGQHFMTQQVVTVAGGQAAATVFIKAAEYSRLRMYVSDGGSNQAGADFTLGTQTIAPFVAGTGTNQRQSLTALGGGWFRIEVVGTPGGAATVVNVICMLVDNTSANSFTGDGTSGVYVFGAGIEAGAAGAVAFASSYVPTTTAAVARGGDQLTFPRGFATIGPTSMYVSGYNLGTFNLGGAAAAMVQLASTSPRLWLYNGSGSHLYGLYNNGTTQAVPDSGLTPAVGDRVEALVTLDAAGVTSSSGALNGGAPSVPFAAAANLPVGVAPGDANIALNGFPGNQGFGAYTSLKIVGSVRSFAAMRSL